MSRHNTILPTSLAVGLLFTLAGCESSSVPLAGKSEATSPTTSAEHGQPGKPGHKPGHHGGHVRVAVADPGEGHVDGPTLEGVGASEEEQLYLTPGGIYTQQDIDANGRLTAAQKFKGVMAAHDRNPGVGEPLCPITLTKANPKFTWVIGGKTYQFCCPPCVDEFVRMAKERPQEIKPPEQYVKRP